MNPEKANKHRPVSPDDRKLVDNILHFLNTGHMPPGIHGARMKGGTLLLLEPDGKPDAPKRQEDAIQVFPSPFSSKPGLES